MSEPIVIAPGAGEIIGDAPDRRVEVLSDADHLHVTWSRFGPGRDGAGRHVHYKHTDLFYVLEGELTVKLGAGRDETAVQVGSLAIVPPLVVHGFRNASDDHVRYLNLHAPGEGFIDYMRGLRDGTGVDFDQHDPPPDGGRPQSEATVGGAEMVIDRPDLRVRSLADFDELAVTETWIGAGETSSPEEDDRDGLESIYVLEGELAIALGDRALAAPAGTWVQLPPGSGYEVSPAGSPARFLTVRAPNA